MNSTIEIENLSGRIATWKPAGVHYDLTGTGVHGLYPRRQPRVEDVWGPDEEDLPDDY